MKTITSSGYIVVVVVFAFIAIVLMFWITPDTAGASLTPVLTSVGLIVAVLSKLGQTDAKVEQSVAASEQNAHTLAVVSKQTDQALRQVSQQVDEGNRVSETISRQVDDNTAATERTLGLADVTHKLVNSRYDDMATELKSMRSEIAALQQDKAVLKATAEGAANAEQARQEEHDKWQQ